jgi:uncharacterized protein YukE
VSAFEVTTGQLADASGVLSGFVGELGQAGNLGSASGAAAENAQMEAAIEDFLATWSQSLETLQTNLSTLTQRLTGAGSSYEGAEGDVAGSFGAG